ncbi:hypothetical protein MTR_1g052090 [Medicago truncatula]|uniref:Putative plant transposon protein domain-containing protein n=1 Tax=Medicago truncatula TaxID=3880 RepID=A0A072VJC3_MEDTR|nr:hypothetical protein MTR_1g052090 [Medicago truncatula]
MASTSNKCTRGSRNTQPTQPTQQPIYAKFMDLQCEERFEKIKGYRFAGERKFDFINLQRYPQFETKFTLLGWKNFNNIVVKESNRTIALEFFANAYGKEDDKVFVRGKKVDYSPEAINQFLGLREPGQCHVEWRRSRSNGNFPTDDEFAQILAEIGKVGADYVRSRATGYPTRMNVMADCGTSVTLGHCCLINALCNAEAVPVERGDIMFNSKGAIDDTAMTKFERESARQGRHAPQQVQPMQEDAPQHPPLHPMLQDYICGMANWAQDTSSELYLDGPYFGAELSLAADQHRQMPLQGNAFERFGNEEAMENYFVNQRERAQARERRARADYACGKTGSEQRASQFYANIEGSSEDEQ